MAPPHRTVAYKDVSYSQLRSFAETARLGSMAAAAKSLDLSHATIWKQIRALEKQLGEPLIESRGRRSALTEAGRLLVDLASPVVAEFEILQERFQQARHDAPRHLSAAASPRICVEDLPRVIEEFRRRYADVRLTVREAFEHQAKSLIESGEVDFVIGDRKYCPDAPDIVVEPVYLVEPMVIMPPRHPLARRRRIGPGDIAKYPILNRPDSYPDDEVCDALQRAGAFDHPDRVYDLVGAAPIRRAVLLGYGIGLVGRVASNPPYPGVCERSLKHCFKPMTCYAYSARRITRNAAQTAFLDLAREILGDAALNA
jgi:molybdate transport repressor ModE-like protein